MNDSSKFTTDRQDKGQSICPAGWRLPTYEGNKSFLMLQNSENFTAGADGDIQNSPAYFVYTGSMSRTGIDSLGFTGYYQSSVEESDTRVYLFYFLSANGLISPQSSGGRNTGVPVRCVAR